MKRAVVVLGTFDIKGTEFAYMDTRLRQLGLDTVTVDLGTGVPVGLVPDHSAASMLGDVDFGKLDRLERMQRLADCAAELVGRLLAEGRVQGIISMGGGQGTFLANRVYRTLPIGLPKFLLSVIALLENSSRQFLGLNDTVVMNSLVDIAGLNSILCEMIDEACAALAGMVTAGKPDDASRERKKAVAVSCWGVTTPCVNTVRDVLEQNGCEVYVFHANGDGGAMLEKLVEQGRIDAVADVTLSEVSMPLVTDAQTAVPGRLESAGKRGIPQVWVPGGLDMLLARPDEVDTRYAGRQVYRHTEDVVFVRSAAAENRAFGKAIAEKANACAGKLAIMLPLRGLSAVDREGGPLYHPAIDQELFRSLRNTLNDPVEWIALDNHINDIEFATAVAEKLLAMF